MHNGKQYVGVLSGVGGWAGIGLAAGLTEDTAGLGAVGAYKALSNYTQLGGVLTVFALPVGKPFGSAAAELHCHRHLGAAPGVPVWPYWPTDLTGACTCVREFCQGDR